MIERTGVDLGLTTLLNRAKQEIARLKQQADENGMAAALLEADLLATKNELAEWRRKLIGKTEELTNVQHANIVMKDALEGIWSNSDDEGAIECVASALDVIAKIGKLKAGNKVLIKDRELECVITDIQYEHDRYQVVGISGWLYGISQLKSLGE
ncbi:hypothetical protein [Paenibacillus peoriae]|uniref:hypothetical protein n=1 Tax=Paenibacillus peoriae TaxID=59893 RepID=UPI00096C9BF2|nr:hypothetical protein [Paenibacillus peoriae]OMF48621.1 hypothetical protein BK135_10025 [Paenibacillus peoriae]